MASTGAAAPAPAAIAAPLRKSRRVQAAISSFYGRRGPGIPRRAGGPGQGEGRGRRLTRLPWRNIAAHPPRRDEMVTVLQQAPEFRAPAVWGKGEVRDLSLSDYRGKWVVLFFYPLDFTFVCPTEIPRVLQASQGVREPR